MRFAPNTMVKKSDTSFGPSPFPASFPIIFSSQNLPVFHCVGHSPENIGFCAAFSDPPFPTAPSCHLVQQHDGFGMEEEEQGIQWRDNTPPQESKNFIDSSEIVGCWPTMNPNKSSKCQFPSRKAFCSIWHSRAATFFCWNPLVGRWSPC